MQGIDAIVFAQMQVGHTKELLYSEQIPDIESDFMLTPIFENGVNWIIT